MFEKSLINENHFENVYKNICKYEKKNKHSKNIASHKCRGHIGLSRSLLIGCC